MDAFGYSQRKKSPADRKNILPELVTVRHLATNYLAWNAAAMLPKQSIRRLTHWLNVVAVVVLVMSGWRTCNASALFPFGGS